jgi:DNA-directed RNA polymerase beta' subunit
MSTVVDVGLITGIKKIKKRENKPNQPIVRLNEFEKRRERRQIEDNIRTLNTEQDIENVDITGLTFCTFDNATLEKISVGDISNRITKNITNQQIIEILNDPRFGVTSSGDVCTTCKNNQNKCPGHLSHLTLAEPIINPIYFRRVISVLRSVCNTCGEMILTDDQIIQYGINKYSGNDRLSIIERLSKDSRCTIRRDGKNILKCKANPEFETDKLKDTMKILVVYPIEGTKKKKETPTEMPLKRVIEILDSISDETAIKLGFTNGSHPRNFILYSIPIIPPCNRPGVLRKGKLRPDPITVKYQEIVSINLKIKNTKSELNTTTNPKTKNKLEEQFENLIRQLYLKVQSLSSDNNANEVDNMSVRRNIKVQLKGKEGYMRQNVLGKRVDYCARTVIGPEPLIDFGQIRIPKSIALTLSVPVTVNSINKNEILKFWHSGEVVSIIQREGRNKDKLLYYSDVKNEVLPDIGDVINRHVKDGDYVLFNRQPSLHRYSIIAYQVVIGKDETIGLHLSSTTPANADFDGDEANVHVLQDIGATSEAINLASMSECLISSQNFKPSSGLVVDAATGSYILTQEDVFVNEAFFFDTISNFKTKVDFSSLKERCTRQGVVYSVPIQLDDMIKNEEEKLKRKLTELELNELTIKSTGTSILKPKNNLSKKEIDSVIPDDLPILSLEEFLEKNLNLDFIQSDELREALRVQLINSDTNLNRFEIPIRIKEQIMTLYNNLIDQYKKSWIRVNNYIIPSIKVLLEFERKKNPKINRKQLTDQYYSVLYVKEAYIPKKYSGRALYSSLFPSDFAFVNGDLRIIEGIIKSGNISKKTAGTVQGSIIQALAKDYSNQRSIDFITDASYLAVRYITERGFSIGLKDCIPPNESNYKEFMNEKIKETIETVKALEEQKKNTNNTDEKDIIESKIIATVDVGKSIGSFLISKAISKDNPFYVMAKAGSKGNETNIAQISGIISQQFTGSTRIEQMISGGTRCLPYFKPGDMDPQARGFCTSSYLSGLTPHELFFSQASSRLGTIDTNVNTKQSGALRRTLASALANLKTEYDNTVRNSNGRIFQFMYGDDMFDGSKLELFKNGRETVILFFNPFRLADRLNSSVWIE